MRGCWIIVDDGSGAILVDLEPNNFTIPLNQVGNTAQVYGNVTLVEGKKKLKFVPGSPYIIGKKVEDIEMPKMSTLALVVKEGRAIIPSPETVIEEGDKVFIYALQSAIAKLEWMFKANIPVGP